MKENIAGNRIKAARLEKYANKKRKLSQAALAAQMELEGVEMSGRTLSYIEKGDRYVTDIELVTFAKVLGKSVMWLLGED